MRVAWLGANPADDAGVPYVATQILQQLAVLGCEVDCFIPGTESELPVSLRNEENLRFFFSPTKWEWDRWYSRKPLAAFVTAQTMRVAAQVKLAGMLARRNDSEPYDCVYQFSQIEATAVRRVRRRLSALLIHPQVHSAGELRWHKREATVARRCEPVPRQLATRALLTARTAVQRRDIRLADALIAPSSCFADDLARDYGYPREQITVVPNPIDLERYSRDVRTNGNAKNSLTLLFVSRISVRKGVEDIVALSHRLADLAGRIRLRVVGNHTLWSDYRPLLASLNLSVAEYTGSATPTQLANIYREADALIQPSHYEPFGITVGEALASGVPVVVTSSVGAAENVNPSCCRVVPDGALDHLEAEVRKLLDDVRGERRSEIRAVARSEAERLFAPSAVGASIVNALARVASD